MFFPVVYCVCLVYCGRISGRIPKLAVLGSLANQLASGISCLHLLMLGLQAGGYAYMAFIWVLGL